MTHCYGDPMQTRQNATEAGILWRESDDAKRARFGDAVRNDQLIRENERLVQVIETLRAELREWRKMTHETSLESEENS